LPEKCSTPLLKRKWNMVRQNLVNNRANVERRYNLRQSPNPFKVGELVYYKNHPISHVGKREAAKLMPQYRGPFRIEAFLTPITVKLVHPPNRQFITRAHISLLKPCFQS
jgi:hypothetical protein